ncbi:MAG TPA: hypothetical protein VF823_10880, partial [Anaerolineales bacterium]
MADSTLQANPGQRASSSAPVDHLYRQQQEEYESHQALLNAQSPLVQRFLEAQARFIATAIVQNQSQVRFTLPDRVTGPAERDKVVSIPPDCREQSVGSLIDRLTRTDLRTALRQRLSELEQSTKRGVALGASLTRHATVLYMVRSMLPSGRSVTYTAVDGEEIPTIPAGDLMEPGSAITATTDAIAEEQGGESGRGELLVPYVPAARRFYLPQWVAFDDEGHLLVNSANEAEAHLASMQRFLS